VAEAIRAVGGHVEVEDGIEGQDLAERLSWHAVLEDEDAVGVLPHPELDRRTEHPWGFVPADGLHAEALVHRGRARSGRRVRNEVAGLDVWRAGQDSHGREHGAERRERCRHLPTQIQIGKLQMRRSGNLPDRDDPRDHQPLASKLDRPHLGAGVDQRSHDRRDRRVEGRVVAQPAKRELH
jgi:hypothetical protein